MARALIPVLAVAIAASTGTGCTAIKRFATKGDYAHGFDAMIPKQRTKLTELAQHIRRVAQNPAIRSFV